MKLYSYGLLFLGSVGTLVQSKNRCIYGQKCWPSTQEWNGFNASIDGRLVISRPPAAVCHKDYFNEAACAAAQSGWNDSFWRTSQVGAYSAILWEMGNEKCFINDAEGPCEQGLVPIFSVAAKQVADIQKSIKFALKKNLYVVIKNTGHEHLGRSSGKGSFSIWTHNLKGREWHESFVPKGSPNGTPGIPAVTLQPGEQWLDVYRDASAHNVTVVGGSARTVGAAGGWLTGGGHSPFSHFYGLGVDNLLEVTIVTPQGDHKILNAYCDPEYFWAVRGGGGSSWGVLTSVTYKTHPLPSHIQVVFGQFNTTTREAERAVLGAALKALPAITDAGYTGYGSGGGGSLGLIFVQPNGTNATAATALSRLYQITALPNVSGQAGSFNFPDWSSYGDMFLRDPNIATNLIDPSRLLTQDVLLNKTEELLDVIDDFSDMAPGFNFIGKVNPTGRESTAVHPVWRESRCVFSMSTDWADNAPEIEKQKHKQRAVEASKRLAQVVGPDGGTYTNEANPFEPNWQQVFWGKENYARLLKVKKRIDPSNLLVCNRCVGTDIVYQP